MGTKLIACAGLCLLLLINGCSQPEEPRKSAPAEYSSQIRHWQLNKQQVALVSTDKLVEVTHRFLETGKNREAWQTAWIAAHGDWLEASLLLGNTGVIDAWPIEPGFLDSIPHYNHSGLVNDLTIQINSETLRQQHQITDDSEVALGYHVLEYYAFTRNDDEIQGATETLTRRKLLIGLAADMLLLDMNALSTEFAGPNNAQLTERMHEKSQAILSEFNRLGEHSQFSQQSLNNIERQLSALNEILNEPIAFNNYLIALDPELAETFNRSLLEAIELVRDRQELDEATMSRMLLLLTSLSHQLDDFSKLTP